MSPSATIVLGLVLSITSLASPGDQKALNKANRAVRSRSYVEAAQGVLELSKHGIDGLDGLERALSNRERAVVVFALAEIGKLGVAADSLLPELTKELKKAEAIPGPDYVRAVTSYSMQSILVGLTPLLAYFAAHGPLYDLPKKTKKKGTSGSAPPVVSDLGLRAAYLRCVIDLLGHDREAVLGWSESLPDAFADLPDVCTDVELMYAGTLLRRSGGPMWPSLEDLPDGATPRHARAWLANAVARALAGKKDEEEGTERRALLLAGATQLLDAEDPGVRWRALSVVCQSTFAPCDLDRVRGLLGDPLPAVRLTAMRGLQRDHTEAPEDVDWVLRMAEDRSSEAASFAALEILAHLEVPTAASIEVLRKTLKTDLGPRLLEAVDGAGRCGPLAADCLPPLEWLRRRTDNEGVRARIDAAIQSIRGR